MNCTELDESVRSVHAFVRDDDVGFATGVTLALAVSTLLLAYGELCVRFVGAVIGGLGGTVSVYVLSDVVRLPCPARVAVAVVSGVFLSLFALCAFTTGIVLLGAAAFGSTAHFVYDALPLEKMPPPFLIAGRSGYYYLTMTVAVVAGGVVAVFQKKNLIRVSSSLIGGAGVSVTTFLVVDRAGGSVGSLTLLLVMLVAACLGVCVQRALARRRKRRRTVASAPAPRP